MNGRNIICVVILLILLFSCGSNKETTLTDLERLIQGNENYMDFHLMHPHQTKERLKEITTEQNPFAVVVSCSDSRVPPEIIFDQGLGDLFVIRTAGNIIGDYELASIEYAVQKLKCKTIMILGHEGCGALKAFVEQPVDSLPGHLNALIDFIRKEPNAIALLEKSNDAYYQEVINNILYGVTLVKNNSTIIRDRYLQNQIEIYGAIYQMKNGNVQIISTDLADKTIKQED